MHERCSLMNKIYKYKDIINYYQNCSYTFTYAPNQSFIQHRCTLPVDFAVTMKGRNPTLTSQCCQLDTGHADLSIRCKHRLYASSCIILNYKSLSFFNSNRWTRQKHISPQPVRQRHNNKKNSKNNKHV